MIRHLIGIIFMPCLVAIAQCAPASDESIRELIRITEIRKLTESAFAQMDAALKTSMPQAFGPLPTAEQQRMADGFVSKVRAMLKEEWKWDVFESLYIKIYRQTFTQEEVDGMLVFYRSPIGQAVIKKMPLVMHQSTAVMEDHVALIARKIEKARDEALAEIRALSAKPR